MRDELLQVLLGCSHTAGRAPSHNFFMNLWCSGASVWGIDDVLPVAAAKVSLQYFPEAGMRTPARHVCLRANGELNFSFDAWYQVFDVLLSGQSFFHE